MLKAFLVLAALATLHHFLSPVGLSLLGMAAALLTARDARTRRRNPAPQPPTTHGRRR